MKSVLVFDIETIPDVPGLRRLHGLDPALSDAEVAEMAFQQRRAQSGSDFLPHYLQRVAVISCALRSGKDLRVWSLAEPEQGEAEIIQRFFDGIEKFTPQLVSWNGGGFDLPVLHYRGLIHGVHASRYWDQGEDDRDFRFNNYISRYHARHTDLMDLLALYNGRAAAPLDQMARLCGFPGKLGMDGSQVWDAWRSGLQDEIRDYCETDVANTWLLFCRFQLMRGAMTPDEYEAEIMLTRRTLGALEGDHWREFLAAWPS